ncbi:hypothetical protein DOTSEDRAFT_80397 [Dothistroma septosporum NZE10]|uniref:Tat pathway signal sequence n=1 Tax=Dothistroma septosporum (strain NZE10 / CBS 128990) TaxID=675120 RepID=N1PQV7_DOTSN|nr:hypothetical protein DOTSEDRAFT_80397 [Dothistroma septosporum NZE10]
MSLESQPFEKASFLSDVDSETTQSLRQTLFRPQNDRQRQFRQYTLLALNVSILLLSILLNISTWVRSSSTASAIPAGNSSADTSPAVCVHETDMLDAREAIEYEQRVFTGALMYDTETKRVQRMKDAEREYFGAPSKELDDAWGDLLHGEFPVMTDEEAAPYTPELTKLPMTDRYHFEPDVTHTLHCLNVVRQEVSKTLYNVSSEQTHGDNAGLPEGWDIAHMEHCMDRIRQSVMCHGDLAPSPLYHWEGFGIALGRTGVHTCRKWENIRQWIDDRNTRGPTIGAR